MAGAPRAGLMVVGIGNTLREDDGVGIRLVQRLDAHFGGVLACRQLFSADLSVAEELAQYSELVVVDALAPGAGAAPFTFTDLAAGPRYGAGGGLVTHTFDWGFVLAATRDLFHGTVRARMLGVAGARFGLGETLSAECSANADAAFRFLVEHCAGR